MSTTSQPARAFLDGFLAMFGLLVSIGVGWYVYNNSLSEFAQFPIIQELTDTYKIGWNETRRLGDELAARVITIQNTTGDATRAGEQEPELTLEIPWHWSQIEAKLLAEGWSSGKMKAAYAFLAYIDQYMDEAVKDMHASGIPASITLAQGILESDAGRSKLARQTNNHFGIKALPTKEGRRKIKAKRYRELTNRDFRFREPAIDVSQHHDDHKYDRFEVYHTVSDSYLRHSRLLQNSCRKARKGCYAWIWHAFPVQKERLDISEMARVFEPISGYAPKDFFGETQLPYYAAQAAGLKMAGYATSKTYHKKLVYLIETYELWRMDAALVQASG